VQEVKMNRDLQKTKRHSALGTKFFNDDAGAVTVDWVVLSAFVVIIGALVIGIYRDGLFDLSGAVQDELTDAADDVRNN
jgi:hypothetical protein